MRVLLIFILFLAAGYCSCGLSLSKKSKSNGKQNDAMEESKRSSRRISSLFRSRRHKSNESKRKDDQDKQQAPNESNVKKEESKSKGGNSTRRGSTRGSSRTKIRRQSVRVQTEEPSNVAKEVVNAERKTNDKSPKQPTPPRPLPPPHSSYSQSERSKSNVESVASASGRSEVNTPVSTVSSGTSNIPSRRTADVVIGNSGGRRRTNRRTSTPPSGPASPTSSTPSVNGKIQVVISSSNASKNVPLKQKIRPSLFSFDDPHLTYGRRAVVHFFEWKWSDVARECSTFLIDSGFGAVIVSSPTEHSWSVDRDGNISWWHRESPVSSKIGNRSGSEREFIGMIKTCNDAGVRVIVDVVLNQMANVNDSYNRTAADTCRTTLDSVFNGPTRHFPQIAFTVADFNDARCDHEIKDWHNVNEVRNCRWRNRADLDHSQRHVRSAIVEYLNRLVGFGVLGFRINAASLIWPDDLGAILSEVDELNPKYFGRNKNIFVINDLQHGKDVFAAKDYTEKYGRYVNNGYGRVVTDSILNRNGKTASNLLRLRDGFDNENISYNDVLNIIDDPDAQRRPAHNAPLTYRNGLDYSMAVCFMLASTYGLPSVMSGYEFGSYDQGPPMDGENISSPKPALNPLQRGCEASNSWTCEHSWAAIKWIGRFRATCDRAAMALLHIEHGNCIAFARLRCGYFAFNNDLFNPCRLVDRETSLPDGNYCNIYAQERDTACRPENVVQIKNGKLTLEIRSKHIIAIDVASRIGGDLSRPMVSNIPENAAETVIFLKASMNGLKSYEKYVFLRGGDTTQSDCHLPPNAKTKCAIPMRNAMFISFPMTRRELNASPNFIHVPAENWAQGDNYLDFFGPEPLQGTHDGYPAGGTPMIQTSDDRQSPFYHLLNARYKLGDNFHLAKLEIDCTRYGRFEIKVSGFLANNYEPDARQCRSSPDCANPSNGNHIVQCGRVNVFTWGVADCTRY